MFVFAFVFVVSLACVCACLCECLCLGNDEAAAAFVVLTSTPVWLANWSCETLTDGHPGEGYDGPCVRVCAVAATYNHEGIH